MRILASPVPAMTAEPSAEKARSFDAETRFAEPLPQRPDDLPTTEIGQRLSELEAWFYSKPSSLDALADAKSMYSGEELDKMPQNLANLIAGFCIDRFKAVRYQIGDNLWQEWEERSFQ